jgi:toxin ParE1/3/4
MRFHDAAAQELVEAAAWYEAKSAGVGGRFLDEIEQSVSMLAENPGLGATWEHSALPADFEVRRFPLRVFPFLVVYVLEPSPVIIAIAHGSRVPGYWAQRLR